MLKEQDALPAQATVSLAERRAFMKLPLDERRRILSEQSERAARYYEQEQDTQGRERWQGGDIVEL
jgi:hypothetical protein